MAPQADDLTVERAAAIKLYEKLFQYSPDTEAMEAGDDKDFEAIRQVLKTTRQEALRDVLSDLDSLHWKDHWYADQLRRKINERLL